MKSTKSLTAIVKTTTKCNLDCLYCYETKNMKDMREITLKNTIKKIAEFNGYGKTTEFIWHGGEPLLRGINFFEKIVKYQKDFWDNYHFSNKVQTNATLLKKDFVNFFRENKFRVGVSLDGSEKFHNQTRPSKNGSETFNETVKGIELARSKGILGGAISVISKVNISHLNELYNFFKIQELNVKLNPILQSVNSSKYFSKIGITAKEYGNAMTILFDKWWKEKEKFIKIEPFEQIIKGILTKKPIGCNYREGCQEEYISISPSGDVYPCGRFSGFQEFRLGNINRDSINDLQKSSPRNKLRQRNVKECNLCEYKYLCNSECPLTSYLSGGDINSKSDFCESNKILFSHIVKRLSKEVEL